MKIPTVNYSSVRSAIEANGLARKANIETDKLALIPERIKLQRKAFDLKLGEINSQANYATGQALLGIAQQGVSVAGSIIGAVEQQQKGQMQSLVSSMNNSRAETIAGMISNGDIYMTESGQFAGDGVSRLTEQDAANFESINQQSWFPSVKKAANDALSTNIAGTRHRMALDFWAGATKANAAYEQEGLSTASAADGASLAGVSADNLLGLTPAGDEYFASLPSNYNKQALRLSYDNDIRNLHATNLVRQTAISEGSEAALSLAREIGDKNNYSAEQITRLENLAKSAVHNQAAYAATAGAKHMTQALEQGIEPVVAWKEVEKRASALATEYADAYKEAAGVAQCSWISKRLTGMTTPDDSYEQESQLKALEANRYMFDGAPAAKTMYDKMYKDIKEAEVTETSQNFEKVWKATGQSIIDQFNEGYITGNDACERFANYIQAIKDNPSFTDEDKNNAIAGMNRLVNDVSKACKAETKPDIDEVKKEIGKIFKEYDKKYADNPQLNRACVEAVAYMDGALLDMYRDAGRLTPADISKRIAQVKPIFISKMYELDPVEESFASGYERAAEKVDDIIASGAVYFDDRKKDFVFANDRIKSQFENSKLGAIEYIKESFGTNITKAYLTETKTLGDVGIGLEEDYQMVYTDDNGFRYLLNDGQLVKIYGKGQTVMIDKIPDSREKAFANVESNKETLRKSRGGR